MAVALLHESTFDEAVPSTETAEPESRRQDRRSEVRLSAEDASWLRGARLKYGPEVRVIDVSTGGILVESDGSRTRAPRQRRLRAVGTEGHDPRPRARPPQSGDRERTEAAISGRVRVQAPVVDRHACRGAPRIRRHAVPARAAAPAPSSSRASWQRVVARFRNGQLVRGYTNDFHPSKPHLHLTPEDRAGEPTFVAVGATQGGVLRARLRRRPDAGRSERLPGREPRPEGRSRLRGRRGPARNDAGLSRRRQRILRASRGCRSRTTCASSSPPARPATSGSSEHRQASPDVKRIAHWRDRLT